MSEQGQGLMDSELSEEFEIKAEMHQGSVCHLFLLH